MTTRRRPAGLRRLAGVTTRLGLAVAALALVAGGCGGSGSDHSSSTPTEPAPVTSTTQPAPSPAASTDDRAIEQELARADAESAQDDADLSALDGAEQRDGAGP